VVELVDVSVTAVQEIETDGLTNQTRLTGGDLLGRLVTLRSMVGERDFAGMGASRKRDPPRCAVECGNEDDNHRGRH